VLTRRQGQPHLCPGLWPIGPIQSFLRYFHEVCPQGYSPASRLTIGRDGGYGYLNPDGSIYLNNGKDQALRWDPPTLIQYPTRLEQQESSASIQHTPQLRHLDLNVADLDPSDHPAATPETVRPFDYYVRSSDSNEKVRVPQLLPSLPIALISTGKKG
jgi:hypothetical protein